MPAPVLGNITEGIVANATTVAAVAQDLSAWLPFSFAGRDRWIRDVRGIHLAHQSGRSEG